MTQRAMTQAVEVRPATPADHPALQALYQACRATAAWLPPDARCGSDLAHDSYGERLWLAQHGAAGPVLGFVGVWMPESFIHHLYVRADARRSGVGRALLQAVAAHCPPPWQLRCLQANTEALAFYQRLGWHAVAQGLDGDGPYLQLQQGPLADAA